MNESSCHASTPKAHTSADVDSHHERQQEAARRRRRLAAMRLEMMMQYVGCVDCVV